MAYYQGDYYQGDYYQGDPFFGALLGMGVSWLGKKLLGRGAKAAGTTAIARVGAGAATGIATGAAATGIGAAALRYGSSLWAQQREPMNLRITQALGAPGAAGPTAVAGCCAPGFHMNKAATRAGHPPGTVCVRNRSMNVANPRALRRSLRRVAGFGKLAMRAKKDIRRAAKSIGA